MAKKMNGQPHRKIFCPNCKKDITELYGMAEFCSEECEKIYRGIKSI